MMVMLSRIPKRRWVNAIHNPAKMIQITFSKNESMGMEAPFEWTDLPKGANVAIPILMACKPHGMPIMVQQRINPPQRYPRKDKRPPKMIQIMFPKRLMILINYGLNRGY
jgi:hypothetical protein